MNSQRLPEHLGAVRSELKVSERWVRERLGAEPSALFAVQVKGDSMEPGIRNGDLIVVDASMQQMDRSGDVYLIWQAGRGLRVKRLERLHGGGPIVIASDNPRYLGELVMGSFSDQVRVLGRVLWSGPAEQLSAKVLPDGGQGAMHVEGPWPGHLDTGDQPAVSCDDHLCDFLVRFESGDVARPAIVSVAERTSSGGWVLPSRIPWLWCLDRHENCEEVRATLVGAGFRVVHDSPGRPSTRAHERTFLAIDEILRADSSLESARLSDSRRSRTSVPFDVFCQAVRRAEQLVNERHGQSGGSAKGRYTTVAGNS